MRQLLFATSWGKHRSFVRDAQEPERAQERVWNETWSLLRDSPFWADRLGARAADREARLEDFGITDYETYRPALEACFAGERVSPLSNEEILFWCESSGTSGKRKLFPLTETFRRQFQRTTPPLLHQFTRRFPDFLAKPVLYFAAALPAERSPAGVEVGFISNFNYRHIPGFLQKHYAFPLESFRDSETFLKWAPLYALQTDLSAMIAITPSMVEQFAERIEAGFESVYLPALEGQIALPAGLPPLKATAERIALLKRAFLMRPFSFREVWPGLQFVCCWKSSTCGLQLPKLERYLQGRVPVVDATYSATEGWLTVPLVSGPEMRGMGGALHPGAHRVEFFKAGNAPLANELLPLWKLEAGQDYEVVLTTAMGFIRYRLYDVVRCTGYFHRTPILEFRHKSGNLLSLGQARISEAYLISALDEIGQPARGRWVFAPNAFGDQLLLYSDQEADGSGALQRIARHVHQKLCELNPDYAADIESRLLKPVGVEFLEPGHAYWTRSEHAQSKQAVLRQAGPGT